MLGTRESEAERECLARGNQRLKGVLGTRESESEGSAWHEGIKV